MANKLIFDPHVQADLSSALDYYESISMELANRFRDRVNNRLDDIAERPESFALDVTPIHYAKVRSFPYLIFFVVKIKYVSILAIVHGSSNPSKWQNRSQT